LVTDIGVTGANIRDDTALVETPFPTIPAKSLPTARYIKAIGAV
jgi:hypothetical protein